MAKVQSFADKMGKSGKGASAHCQKCGELIAPVKLITSEKSEKTGAYQFKERIVGMCKCNEGEIIQ